jgi:N-acetyl-anhydromuramyl-L-alanine amidase AmpD
VQSVDEKDTAFAAPGVNHDGIQYELSGYAEQTATEWDDDYSVRTLDLASKLVALSCIRWDIPVRLLSIAAVKRGEAGICGHVHATKAFKRSTHTDPGKNFPWKDFIAMVRRRVEEAVEGMAAA